MGWLKGYLRGYLSGSLWRVWSMTVLPTSLVFLVMSAALQCVVRRALASMDLEGGQSAVELFDAAHPGGYILVGALLPILISTAWMQFAVSRSLFRPFQEVIRLAREMAEGNYGVRADPRGAGGRIYRELAASINLLAESLQRTERLRRELVANMAHEIRTPLTNLQGYLEALRDGVIEPNHEALSSVHEEVLRLVRLVDALHHLARADAMRHQGLEYTLTDLDSLTEQLVRVIRPNAEAKGIKLYLDLGAQHVPVPVHADSIAQVMRNLLRNAAQYSDHGGTIRVQTSQTQGFYRFTCLNTGAGIAPEELPFIFKRFYRTSKAKKGEGTGVGIGLAIAKELVEAHGGRIGADSKAGWTLVWVELPMEPGSRLEPG